VCCRAADYAALAVQLSTYGTLSIRPLTDDQIDDFLAQAGSGLDGLRAALAAHPDLRRELRSPLMLSVAALAYSRVDGSAEDAADSNAGPGLRLWPTYVRAMLTRRPDPRHPPDAIVGMLSHVAANLNGQGLTILSIDAIDDSWLGARKGRLIHTLWAGLLCALSMAAVAYPLFGGAGVAIAVTCGVNCSLFYFLSSSGESYLAAQSRRMLQAKPQDATLSRPRQIAIKTVDAFKVMVDAPWATLLILVLGALIPGMSVLIISHDVRAAVATWVGSGVGIMSAFFCLEWLDDAENELGLTPPRSWYGEVPSPNLMRTLPVTIIVGGIGGLTGGAASGAVFWVVGGTLSWAFAVVACCAIVFSIVIINFIIPVGEQAYLRWHLARRAILPWPCRPSLDYAVRVLLLRRAGEDYLFAHRDLLDFFDNLGSDSELRQGDRFADVLPQQIRRP
jgi:hypothetical protein